MTAPPNPAPQPADANVRVTEYFFLSKTTNSLTLKYKLLMKAFQTDALPWRKAAPVLVTVDALKEGSSVQGLLRDTRSSCHHLGWLAPAFHGFGSSRQKPSRHTQPPEKGFSSLSPSSSCSWLPQELQKRSPPIFAALRLQEVRNGPRKQSRTLPTGPQHLGRPGGGPFPTLPRRTRAPTPLKELCSCETYSKYIHSQT